MMLLKAVRRLSPVRALCLFQLRTSPSVMTLLSSTLLLLLLLLPGKDDLATALPVVAHTDICNPFTLENGCDCTSEWWEPVMYLCNPCGNICKWNAPRDRCLQDCPVFYAAFFTTSTPTSTSESLTQNMTSLVTGKSLPSTDAGQNNVLLITLGASLAVALFCAFGLLVWCNYKGRSAGRLCGMFERVKYPTTVEDQNGTFAFDPPNRAPAQGQSQCHGNEMSPMLPGGGQCEGAEGGPMMSGRELNHVEDLENMEPKSLCLPVESVDTSLQTRMLTM